MPDPDAIVRAAETSPQGTVTDPILAPPAEPLIERVGTLLKFTWPQWLLTVTLDRFGERGKHVEAECHATTTAPGYRSLLTVTRLTLTATTSKDQFAKRLTKLYPEANWDLVVEAIADWGIKTYREGEPILTLPPIGAAEIPVRTYRIQPLVADDEPTILFGEGGLGKSTVALLCALLVQAGVAHAGLAGVQGTALYLDYESTQRTMVRRAQRLREGCPLLHQTPLHYRRCVHPLATEAAYYREQVSRRQIIFLVIDSLALACGKELKEAEGAIQLFAALRELNVPCLIIAHTAKGDDGQGKKTSVYGSVFFENLSRSVWEIKKAGEGATTRIGLYQRKVNEDELGQRLGLRLTFSGKGVWPPTTTIEAFDVTEDQDLISGLSLKTHLWCLLSATPQSLDQLVETVGKARNIVRARLSELHSEGKATPISQGTEDLWIRQGHP